jgi:hypothetical protein
VKRFGLACFIHSSRYTKFAYFLDETNNKQQMSIIIIINPFFFILDFCSFCLLASSSSTGSTLWEMNDSFKTCSFFVHCFRTKKPSRSPKPKTWILHTPLKDPTCYSCLGWNQNESSNTTQHNTTLNCVCKEPPQTIKISFCYFSGRSLSSNFLYHIIQTGSDSNRPLNAMKMQSPIVVIIELYECVCVCERERVCVCVCVLCVGGWYG